MQAMKSLKDGEIPTYFKTDLQHLTLAERVELTNADCGLTNKSKTLSVFRFENIDLLV